MKGVRSRGFRILAEIFAVARGAKAAASFFALAQEIKKQMLLRIPTPGCTTVFAIRDKVLFSLSFPSYPPRPLRLSEGPEMAAVVKAKAGWKGRGPKTVGQLYDVVESFERLCAKWWGVASKKQLQKCAGLTSSIWE